jgi:hypothetical protein
MPPWRRKRISRRQRAVAYADPVIHALIAAAVVAPLVRRSGRGPVIAAVTAATLIDIDHAVAARSLRTEALLTLPARPRSHSLLLAAGTGALAGVLAGPVYGWATTGALVSHLLHDAGDRNAPTPLLWPWAEPRQLGRRWQVGGTVAVALGSWAFSRAAAARAARSGAAASGDGGGATSPPRTA